jgi:hypothetical protein
MVRQRGKLASLAGAYRPFTPSASALSSPSPDRLRLLAKAKETFKLADLQWLEINLQSKIRNDQDYTCDRLLVDGATGSSLYRLNMSTSSVLLRHLQSGGVTQENIGNRDRFKIPSSLRRCEWVAEVLCQESNAEQLVELLRSSGFPPSPMFDGWVLEYVRMDAVGRPAKEVSYNQKTILCSVSQHITGHAALNPTLAKHRLVLVETTDQGMFLARVLPQLFQLYGETRKTPLFRVWSRRPFKFSSAINPVVAEMAVDLLLDLVQHYQHATTQSASLSATPTITIPNHPFRLLDPTCGSGTLLAYCMARGMQVEGWDINPNCVEGCKRNLEFAFGAESTSNWSVHHRDSSQVVSTATNSMVTTTTTPSHLSTFDCAVANLPWGVNTVSYAYENQRILTALRHGLRAQVPVVIVSKTPLNHELEQLGFQILGHAHVPQQDFTLPNKKNLRKREENPGEPKGRSDCVVTVVIST